MPLSIAHRLLRALLPMTRGGAAPWGRMGAWLPEASGQPRLGQPYRQSVWVHAAIRRVADPIAGQPLSFAEVPPGPGDGPAAGRRAPRRSPAPSTDPRLESFWDRPAEGLDGFAEFVAAVVGWRKLAGEAFLVMGDDALAPFPEVRTGFPRLLVVRPDRMRHVVKDGRLVAWEMTDGAGLRHSLLPEQVVHLRQWNPYDDHRGLGDYEAARLAAETDFMAAIFARNLANAQGDQGSYIIAKNGVLDQAQRDQITAVIQEKRRLQAAGIFRPAFLTGDIQIEDPKVRTADLAALEARKLDAAAIFLAFGVPPSMASASVAGGAGADSDRQRLIFDTCIPEAARLAGAISRVSSTYTGRRVRASFSWDEHPAVQTVRHGRMQALDALWAVGMPVRDASEYLDLDLPRFPGDSKGWIPMGRTLNRKGSSGPSAAAAPGDAIGNALRALRARLNPRPSSSNPKPRKTP